MPVYNPDIDHLDAAIKSVEEQFYPFWELCIADDASTDSKVRETLERAAARDSRIKVVIRERNGHVSAASNTALEIAGGEYIALLDQDDLIRPHALLLMAEAINQRPDAGLLYSDEDKIDDAGNRSDPYFKCDWNPDLLRSHNMICHLGIYDAKLVRDLGGFRIGYEDAQDYDLCLRCSERLRPDQIIHLPFVLYHWRTHDKSTSAGLAAKPYALTAGERALQDHLSRTASSGRVETTEEGYYRVRYPIPSTEPSVTLVVPTKDKVEVLRTCISSVLSKTSYQNYKITVIDNGSSERETSAYLAEITKNPRVSVLRDPRPFNYSQLNNEAVSRTDSDLVCLLNNDVEVLTPEWLAELVGIAIQPGVGAVGARLWYPDMTLQHGGVVMGLMGVASHAHKGLPRQNSGYFSRASLIQEFSAVTGACLMLKRALYLSVGGLNESDLAIAFSDVDLCLKLKEAGFRNVWSPYADLIHHESVSRGADQDPVSAARFLKEVNYMRHKWRDLIAWDPAYSPNLTLSREDFSLAFPPRVSLDDPYCLHQAISKRT